MDTVNYSKKINNPEMHDLFKRLTSDISMRACHFTRHSHVSGEAQAIVDRYLIVK